MPFGPTTPVWNTPNLHYDAEQVTLGDWNDLGNDVALLYAAPWMKYGLVSGGYTYGAAFNEGGIIFTNDGGSTYTLRQNSPSSGVGSYSVSTGGTFSLPTNVNGLYRVRAQVQWQVTSGFTPGMYARVNVGWINGSGLYYVDYGPTSGAYIGGTIGSPDVTAGTSVVESIFPGYSSPYGTCTQFQVFLCPGQDGTVIQSVPYPNSTSVTVTPGSTPPAYVTFVTCQWVCSDGDF